MKGGRNLPKKMKAANRFQLGQRLTKLVARPIRAACGIEAPRRLAVSPDIDFTEFQLWRYLAYSCSP